MRKAWIIGIVILLLAIVIPGIYIGAVYTGAFGHLQSREELLNYKNATASIVLSFDGELIGKFFSENRTDISYRQLPPHLVKALIATEDARFFDHEGIDSRSLFRVLIKTILFNNHNSGGGSTITQQLAKNMFGRHNYGPLTLFINKTKEAILAHRLEKIFTKEEILTLYLNTVSFGENVYGVVAAAGRYFNKNVELLKVEESAVLVGLLKANNFYNPRLHPENARSRRNVVLNQMKKYKYLKASEADSLCKLPLLQNYANIESGGPADYFLFQVKNEVKKILQNIEDTTGKKWNVDEDGLIINTTLNLTLQKYALKAFHDHLSVMQKRLDQQYQSVAGQKTIDAIVDREMIRLGLNGRAGELRSQEIFNWERSATGTISVSDSLKLGMKLLQAGLLAIDPVNGSVKAWVGGIDFKTQPYDQIMARRQLASTFKPVLYAAAFEDGMDPCHYLDNDSIVLPEFHDWSPENFDHSYGGKFSLAGALARSMNIPTYNLYLKIGFEKLDSLWKKMGFSFRLDNTPSVAIGTAEASIRETAIAYSAFANGGYKITPQSIISITTPAGEVIWKNEFNEARPQILTERTCTLISAILQKAVTEGTGSSMNSIFGVTLPLAGKTGTSQDYADSWFASFNPSLVMICRVGASSPSVHFTTSSNGSGSALALPLVAMTLKKVQSDPVLMGQLITPFQDLSPELASELNCPDYREKNILDKFTDIFKRDKTVSGKVDNNADKKIKSFIRKLFRKNRRL